MFVFPSISTFPGDIKPKKILDSRGFSFKFFIYIQTLFLMAVVLGFSLNEANAQAAEIAPGEAFATRFSGTRDLVDDTGSSIKIINEGGVVGSVVDIRSPRRPALSEHWINEPQHLPVFARDVGQVFGIAIDDANPPNIFLTATAAFGLHRNGDGSGWMSAMWGLSGSPGTVYRLNAAKGYQPEIFAEIMLRGRRNSGAALGNIAYDAINRQLFVSDMETGMIHRLDALSGEPLSEFDHGGDARPSFMDASTGSPMSLPPVAFRLETAARTGDCETDFATSPICWNIANHKRRIWGLGIYAGGETAGSRLYYATWGTEAFADADWVPGSDDARNWIWSVGLNETGDFNLADVRREFSLPDTAGNPDNEPVAISDIAFSRAGIMLVAERGSMRNLGLDRSDAFAQPNHSRVLRYRLDDTGLWFIDGRYDVGNKTVAGAENGIFANSSGGVDWGFGYTANHTIDLRQPDRFAWSSGDSLCSPEGPCFDRFSNDFTDADYVVGLEGVSSDAVSPVATTDAPLSGPERRYKIDLDLNIDGFGQKNHILATRNDNTKAGDIEIYKVVGGRQTFVPPPPFHRRSLSHSRIGSHSKVRSHYRIRSHDINRSHWRYGSHERRESHYRLWSHNRSLSHAKFRSHDRKRSHAKFGSHNKRRSHARTGSHNKKASHARTGSHSKKRSHARIGSHNKRRSHARIGSHSKKRSHARIGSHNKKASHLRTGSHSKKRSHARIGSHSKKRSHARIGSHSKKRSHARIGSHSKKRSHARIGSHSKKRSHARIGSHSKKRSHARIGSHSKTRSHARIGSHSKTRSHLRTKSHSVARSHNRTRSKIRVAPTVAPTSQPKTN